MATPLPTNVTTDNWRRVRQTWQNRMAELGLHGIADSFWEIGHAERFGRPVDDEFCAAVLAQNIIWAMRETSQMGVRL